MKKNIIISLILTFCLAASLSFPVFAEAIQSAEIAVWVKIVNNSPEANDDYPCYRVAIEWDESEDSIVVSSEYGINTTLFNTYSNDRHTVTVNITPSY